MAQSMGPLVAICLLAVAIPLSIAEIPTIIVGGVEIRPFQPTTSPPNADATPTPVTPTPTPAPAPAANITEPAANITEPAAEITEAPVQSANDTNTTTTAIPETTPPAEAASPTPASEIIALNETVETTPEPEIIIPQGDIESNGTTILFETTLIPVMVPTTPLIEFPIVTEVNVTVIEATTTTTLAPQTPGLEPGKPIVSRFDCSSVEPGYYGNPSQPCDTKFYICVDRSTFAYEQRCPARLYYDAETKMCDMWSHIPACTGLPRPPIVVSNETVITLIPETPVIDCRNLTDGNYPDPESTPKPFCSNRFFTCAGGREFRFRCPRGLYYDHERNQCDLHLRVFACSGNRPSNESVTFGPALTLPPVNYDCRGKADGYYVEKCDTVYYSCSGGLAREFRCPDGLVFDSAWFSCEAPHHTFVCTGTQRPTTARPPSTIPPTTQSTTPSPMKCIGMQDDIYRDPEINCSRYFYYCAHGDSYKNICPGNLYYDHEFKRCDLWINIFDCSGIRPTTTQKPTTTAAKIAPVVDFDCSRLNSGNYVNPNNSCSQFYYVCANMEAFIQYCPAGLYYDPDLNNCDAWSNIFACSGQTRVPEPTPAIGNFTTEKPEFDCSSLADGVYTNAVNACSSVYYRCSGAVTFKFTCPSGLYYDSSIDSCDIFDHVFACSGLTRPPPVESTTTIPTPSTEKPPIDCRVLPDGDYADAAATNSCSSFFYTCSAGLAIKRDCADDTYYDPELRSCDRFWKVPVCSGNPRPTTTAAAPTSPTTPGTPPPFDCTRLSDGNYAAGDCTEKYWSCVGGLTFPRQCPMSFIYDAENDDCEYSYHLPKCGGQRPTEPTIILASPTPPPGGFSCAFLPNGNYPDPKAEKGCSQFYYTCANGITARVDCPAGLFYDPIGNACNVRELVPACSGWLLINDTILELTTTTAVPTPDNFTTTTAALIPEANTTTTAAPTPEPATTTTAALVPEANTTTTAAPAPEPTTTTAAPIAETTTTTAAPTPETTTTTTAAPIPETTTTTTAAPTPEPTTTTTASPVIVIEPTEAGLAEALNETTPAVEAVTEGLIGNITEPLLVPETTTVAAPVFENVTESVIITPEATSPPAPEVTTPPVIETTTTPGVEHFTATEIHYFTKIVVVNVTGTPSTPTPTPTPTPVIVQETTTTPGNATTPPTQ